MAQAQLEQPEYASLLQDHQQEMAKTKTASRRTRSTKNSAQKSQVRIASKPLAGKQHQKSASRVHETVKLRQAVRQGFVNRWENHSICPISGRVVAASQAFHIPTKCTENVTSVLPPGQYVEALQERSLQGSFASPAAAIVAIRLNTQLTDTEKRALTANVVSFYDCHPTMVERAVCLGLAAVFKDDVAALQEVLAPSSHDLLNVSGRVTFANSSRGKKKSKDATAASTEEPAAVGEPQPEIPLNEPLSDTVELLPLGHELTIEDITGVFNAADEALLAGH